MGISGQAMDRRVAKKTSYGRWALYAAGGAAILLFAWWFGTQRRWRPFFIALVIALSTREDTAMAVFIMGIVLWWMLTRDEDADKRDKRMALLASALGVVWYAVCTRLVIPAFNQGNQPFYIGYFYGNYGSDTFEIAETIIRQDLRKALEVTRGCRVEVIMKDNHTIGNRPENVVRWCRIAKEEAERISN